MGWIKDRIDSEYRKHKKLDWSKISEAKINSYLLSVIDEKISIERISCKILMNSKSMKDKFTKKIRLQKVESKDYFISILEELKQRFTSQGLGKIITKLTPLGVIKG